MNRTCILLLPSCVGVALGQCAFAAEPFDPIAAGQLPRYVFFNRNPFSNDAYHWRQQEPQRFTPASMREFVETLGTAGNDKLRFGGTFPFSLLENDEAVLIHSIRAMLDASQQAGVPIMIMLDGQNWWQSRSDLWNWWDQSLPGFNPDNRYNVEWTGWGPEYAIKISWRNWGSQIRVRPAPNIFAPKVYSEVRHKMAACSKVIADWYRDLPEDKKWLLGGVKVGWEASINVNAYYYPDGNRIFEQHPKDASRDPQGHDPKFGFTFGQPSLGYSAATSLGMDKAAATQPQGKRELTASDHEYIVHRYLAELSHLVREQGVPAYLIFTHQGGTFYPWDKNLSFKPAINEDSIPGWSFYSHDPQDSGSLAKDLESAGRQQWGAVEWWRGGKDARDWRERFERTLAFKTCRLIAVYNWEPFAKNAAAVQAVRELVRRESADR